MSLSQVGDIRCKKLSVEAARSVFPSVLTPLGFGTTSPAQILCTAYDNALAIEKIIYTGYETCDGSTTAAALAFGLAMLGDTLDADGLIAHTVSKTNAIHSIVEITNALMVGALAAGFKSMPIEWPGQVIIPKGYSLWMTPTVQAQAGETAGSIMVYVHVRELDEYL